MPDETESDQPQPPQPPEQKPSGGAYTQGEKISKINVADEIKNSFLDYSMSVIVQRALMPNAGRSCAITLGTDVVFGPVITVGDGFASV